MNNVKIMGIGSYVPKRIVDDKEIDRLINKTEGWSIKNVGIKERRYVDKETTSEMGASAVKSACIDSNIKLSDLDLICYTGASIEQVIPSTSCLIQRELGLQGTGISCFDINSTCLSFVTALDTLSYLIEAGRYKNVAIVSSEIPSAAINYKEAKSSSLFGDGAVAVILQKTPVGESSKIIKGIHETYSEGADLCKVYGGGSKLPPNMKNVTEETEDLFKFSMEGTKLFKLTLRIMPDYIDRLFNGLDFKLDDIDMVVPHQASLSGMKLIRKKLNIKEEKFMNIVETYGNMISASIPMGLCVGIKDGRIKRGDKILLIGTSAGVSIGSLILEY